MPTKPMSKIILSDDICKEVEAAVQGDYDKLFLLTDTETHRLCLPLLDGCSAEFQEIVIGATDTHKTLATLADVWTALANGGASRRSLLVNLGGGMVTDLGGFAAATFKRGIRFVNVPTTLLAMVDAAVGGKTGINFNGLKNEIGAFRDSEAVIIDTEFLRTLNDENLRSGYAEMLKHALLKGTDMWSEHLRFDLAAPSYDVLQRMVKESIDVKANIVAQDPHEHGLRKALNLGHTVGHAIESLLLERETPVLHGYAVAWGLIGELFLSVALQQFPQDKMRQTTAFIRRFYGTPNISCKDYDQLHALMLHDKKNVGGTINFTLLADVGDIRLNNHAEKDLIFEMLDFLREG
jgi:3-dehydroquinate synthase